MKNKRLLSTILVITMASSVFLYGCSNKSADKGKKDGESLTNKEEIKMDKEQYLNFLLGAEPKTLDPAKVYDIYSSQVHVNIMEALTRLEADENGKEVINPGAATEWSLSDDGLTWTFKLRKMKWNDGVDVTADQFVYGILRTLAADTGSPCGYLLYPIKNAEAYNANKAKAEDVGVKVIDERTLEIKLENPCAHFLNLTYSKIMEPQRKDIIEKHGDRYGSEVDTMVFCGPFIMKEWIHNNRIELEKNPTYWDSDVVKLEKVKMKVIKEENSRMNELFNGSLDMGGVSKKEWIDKFDATGEFEVKKSYDTSVCYTFFNQQDKYFKNAKIRKAFLLVDDREGAVKALYRDLAEPCYAWVPPAVQVGDDEFRIKTNYRPVDELKKENPDAKKLLIKGLKEEGLDPDPSKHTIKLLQSGTSSKDKEFAEFSQQNFQSTLGVKVECDFVEWPIFQKRTGEMDYQLGSQAVFADYNDPMTYFDMWMSTATTVPTGWKNEKFDDIVKKAGKSMDNEERIKLFNEAEKIFIYDDAVISPTVWRFKNTYVRKYVKNYMSPTFGSLDLKKIYTDGREK